MGRFYENLIAKGLKKAEALRQAKAWLRSLTRKAAILRLRGMLLKARRQKRPYRDEMAGALGQKLYAHPFYWAGFILIGDPS